MNEHVTLQRQLAALGEELGSNPLLAEAVRRRIGGAGGANQAAPRALTAPLIWKRWRVSAALAASVLLGLATWRMSQPTPLYARMLAELAKARTVHAEGWTYNVARRWPLEQPLEKKDDKQVRHEMEIWHWTDADGTHRSYERQGPVIAVQRDGDTTEYQQDADLTAIYRGGYIKDRIAEFARLPGYFAALERPSLKKTELPPRVEDGRMLHGLCLTEGNSIYEIWIDELSSLPAKVVQRDKESGRQTLLLSYTIDGPVPASIVSYQPPEPKLVRAAHGGDEPRRQWLSHVAEIGRQLEASPMAGRMALLPRPDGRTFGLQYPMKTSDGKYWVRPFDIGPYQPMTPSYFIDREAASDGERRHGTWRLDKKFHDVELPRADIVYEADVPWQERVQFGLGQFGLEYVDVIEQQTIWVAKHDGRALKPWQQVKPPVPYVVEGGIEKKGYVEPGIGFKLVPVTMQELLADFNSMIDGKDLAADKPSIRDETGLSASPPPYHEDQHGTGKEYRDEVVSKFFVATDSPYFVGHESLEMAKRWYAEEFGITFTEVKEPVTIHVIRKKK